PLAGRHRQAGGGGDHPGLLVRSRRRDHRAVLGGQRARAGPRARRLPSARTPGGPGLPGRAAGLLPHRRTADHLDAGPVLRLPALPGVTSAAGSWISPWLAANRLASARLVVPVLV